MSTLSPDDLEDLLADLQHDLGKYLRQPLAFLPADATEADLREALRVAIHETRRTRRGVRSARAIWAEALEEGGDSLRALDGFRAVEAALQAALALDPESPELKDKPLPERAIAVEIMGRVAEALRALSRPGLSAGAGLG